MRMLWHALLPSCSCPIYYCMCAALSLLYMFQKIHTWLTQALISEEETAAMGGMEKWKELKDPFWDGKIPDFAV